MIGDMPILSAFLIIFICAMLGIIFASLDALWMEYKSRQSRKRKEIK